MNLILVVFISAVQFFSVFTCMEEPISMNTPKSIFLNLWEQRKNEFFEIATKHADIKNTPYPIHNDCVKNLFFLAGEGNILHDQFTRGLFPRRFSTVFYIIGQERTSALFKYFFEKSSPEAFSCELKQFRNEDLPYVSNKGDLSYGVSLYKNDLKLQGCSF
jgi:hypothetical protein